MSTETTRLTMMLRPRAKADLEALQEAWGTNQTDTTVRALRLAALLTDLAGNGPIRIDTRDGVETVRFL